MPALDDEWRGGLRDVVGEGSQAELRRRAEAQVAPASTPEEARRRSAAVRLRMRRRSIDAPLSDREVEVMWLVAEGLSNKRIGAELGVSECTAKFHVVNSILKLAADTRADAAVLFVLARADEARARLLGEGAVP